jgi:hypothetical protein
MLEPGGRTSARRAVVGRGRGARAGQPAGLPTVSTPGERLTSREIQAQAKFRRSERQTKLRGRATTTDGHMGKATTDAEAHMARLERASAMADRGGDRALLREESTASTRKSTPMALWRRGARASQFVTRAGSSTDLFVAWRTWRAHSELAKLLRKQGVGLESAALKGVCRAGALVVQGSLAVNLTGGESYSRATRPPRGTGGSERGEQSCPIIYRIVQRQAQACPGARGPASRRDSRPRPERFARLWHTRP